MGRKARIKKERRASTSPRVGTANAMLTRELAEEGLRVVSTPAGTKKISEALLDLVMPVLEILQPDTKEHFEVVVSMGFVAWNAELMGEAGADFREQATRDLAKAGFLGSVARNLFELLVDRRRTVFANDRRLIASFKVVELPSGEFRVAAAALEDDLGNAGLGGHDGVAP